ncbi:hypothetical protein B0A54_07093 [Friedmanniomyces endolithicus]|uniref:Rhodopsin domain-containing protein n=1 Tax=Friedmanniomyces endolithicus TaxID=329885 RepID=A0A4U0V2W4_9PEZI|nr:hypothetical protein B0A54_07093 [Friedmanniomyces endolithicus]
MRVSFYLKCQLASTILFWSCLWSVKASFLAFFRQLSEGLRSAPPVHISAPQKVALIGVLSLGLIIIGFAVARIVVTDAQGTHPEISWLALWSAIESSVAVLVCCLASFKALFTGKRHGLSREPYYAHSSTQAREAISAHGSGVYHEHGEVRMAGPSSRSRPIPLKEVKGGESRVAHDQWMDDSSSEMEIFGEIPKQRRVP